MCSALALVVRLALVAVLFFWLPFLTFDNDSNDKVSSSARCGMCDDDDSTKRDIFQFVSKATNDKSATTRMGHRRGMALLRVGLLRVGVFIF